LNMIQSMNAVMYIGLKKGLEQKIALA
jgi:hypothetical protein